MVMSIGRKHTGGTRIVGDLVRFSKFKEGVPEEDLKIPEGRSEGCGVKSGGLRRCWGGAHSRPREQQGSKDIRRAEQGPLRTKSWPPSRWDSETQ